jgi:uncharacterized membrane protein YjjP (DUF1212 family)
MNNTAMSDLCVDGPSDGSPYCTEGGRNTYYAMTIPWSIGILIGLVIISVLIPWLVSHKIRPSSSTDPTSERKSSHNDDNGTLSWYEWAIKSLRNGLYIELKARPSIEEEFNEVVTQQSKDTQQDPSRGRDWTVPIGPGCNVSEEEIRSSYPQQAPSTTTSTIAIDVNDPTTAPLVDRIVLVLRLSLALLASGHCTVDAETTALNVCRALKIPSPRISIGHRIMTAQFGDNPAHVLTCERDFVFSTLADLQSFAESIMCREIRNVPAALVVCDRLLNRPLPYGWLVYDLSFWLIAPWATIAAYYGSYWDMLGALCISPFTIFTYHICHLLKITHLEVMLVPLVVGITTPLIWRFVSNAEQDICHVIPQIFGCLLIWLPGAELVWGAMEIFQGSVIHGASRLVKGLLSAISLATFLVLGWQVFGRNFAVGWLYSTDSNNNLLSLEKQRGAIGSLPDSNFCAIPPPYSALPEGTPGYPSYLSWPLVVGVYNMPLNLLCLMNVYIPLRSCLGPFIVGQVGLLSLAFFQFQCQPDTCELPAVIQQMLSAFFATWVAMVVELVQGLPSAISIIPVLFIFAPGSSAVLSVLGVVHRSAGDTRGRHVK